MTSWNMRRAFAADVAIRDIKTLPLTMVCAVSGMVHFVLVRLCRMGEGATAQAVLRKGHARRFSKQFPVQANRLTVPLGPTLRILFFHTGSHFETQLVTRLCSHAIPLAGRPNRNTHDSMYIDIYI